MGVNFSKRFVAFIIDLVIVSCMSSIISFVVPKNDNVQKLSEELTEISQTYIDGKINEKEYIDQSAALTYRIDKENFLLNVIEIVVTILYFVVFAFIKEGQTLGKKVMKIKVVKEGGMLTINDMIFRTFIINTLFYSLASLVFLFTTKDVSYLYAVSIMSFIQFGLIIVSALMILIRKDNLSLHDMITKTKVIEVK